MGEGSQPPPHRGCHCPASAPPPPRSTHTQTHSPAAFLLYCQLPFFRGARFLYLTFVGPWFAAHRAELDAQVARLGGAATVFKEAVQSIATPLQAVSAAAAAAKAAPEVSLDEIFATSGPVRQRSVGAGAAAGGGSDARR